MPHASAAADAVLRDVYLFRTITALQDGVPPSVQKALQRWNLAKRQVRDLWGPSFAWLSQAEAARGPILVQSSQCKLVNCWPINGTSPSMAKKASVYDSLWHRSYVVFAAIAAGDHDLVRHLAAHSPELFSGQCVKVAEYYGHTHLTAFLASLFSLCNGALHAFRMKRQRPEPVDYLHAPPQVEYALRLQATHARATKSKHLSTSRPIPANQAKEPRPTNDSVQVTFPKAPRFRYRGANDSPAAPKMRQLTPQINAGIYVVRNTRTGHAYFGSTWDLDNAKSQNLAELQNGTHVNLAMVRSVAAHGFRDTSFHAIPTGREFHFRELEDTLAQRLALFIARAQKTHVRRLFRRWQHGYFAFAWPLWILSVANDRDVERTAAAIELQRSWRGHVGRGVFLGQRRFCAARRLQVLARGFIARRRLLRLRQDRRSRTIQHAVKGFLHHKQFKHHRRCKAATATLQRVWRGYRGRLRALQRRQALQEHTAARCLQKATRRFCSRRRWQRHRRQRAEDSYATVLQRAWRGHIGRRAAHVQSQRRDNARRLERAAATIQDAYHEFLVRKFQYAARGAYTQKVMARKLSLYWRNYVARKFGWAALQIHLEHKTATRLQRWFRHAAARLRIRRGCYRCKRERRAITLQRVVRGYLARHFKVPTARRIRALHGAANYVGQWYRSLKWARLVRFVLRTKAATQIQAAFRSFGFYRRYQACKTEWREARAAITIQCQFRIHVAKAAFRRRIEVLRQGACAECRAVVASVYSTALALELCSFCLQTIYEITGTTNDRVLPVEVYRRQRAMATKITACYRGYAARLLRTFPACSTCGTKAVRRICLDCPRSACHSCTAMVHALPYNRHHCAWLLAEHDQRVTAAIRLQARARCFFERATLQKLRNNRRQLAAVRLQGWWRARYSRHMARLLAEQVSAHEARCLEAAGAIQRVYRGVRGRRLAADERALRRAVVQVQAHFRGMSARRRASEERQRRREMREKAAAVVIQCALRQFVGRQILHHRRVFVAARRIQCALRVYLAKGVLLALQIEYERQVQLAIEQVKHRRKVRAVTRIQSQYRRRRDFRVAVAKRLEVASERRRLWERVCRFVEARSTRVLQRAYLRHYHFLAAQATRIQSLVRSHAARRVFRQLREEAWERRRCIASVTLQCFGRTIFAKRQLRQLREAAVSTTTTSSPWIECFDEATGYPYYFNTETQETVWDQPADDASAAIHDASDNNDGDDTTKVQTEPKWTECWDESYGAYYYINAATGETTWANPTSNQTTYDWYYDEAGRIVYYTPATDSPEQPSA
ncbi:hypothetical protein ACHHYP_05098 [Achlya hypogyna]|uniref:WW domain-containing protein n=1 Tax=Achlya hypogyna TaxID=1202772 RepID=A0A1V9YZ04_ACHHY|nr:hypothetical protein ACHHYP_05098 [Achlya hypogyna]